MDNAAVDKTKLRAWWSHRQGLDGSLAGKTPAKVLEQVGWMRSVGGSGPYLGLFARCGASREAVDRDVAALALHELPSARGCTYVLPASDFALGLRVGHGFHGSELSVAKKLGVTDAEIAKLSKAVLKALEKGPMEPGEIRTATGSASRNLGEEGKKKGMTTTLPLAFSALQADGSIRRVATNGRLDQQRYKYTLWNPNPLAKYKASVEESVTALARKYFTWCGPASIAEYQWFSALSGKAAKAALEPLKLVAFEEDRLMLPELTAEYAKFKAPKDPQYLLVGGIDNVLLLRRDTLGLPEGKGGTGVGSGLKDLPSHAILDRGNLVGMWEYDPEKQEIAWTSYIKKNADLKAAVARMEAYVRDQLGDARSFSLDSPKSRVPRIAALRAAS